MHKQTLILLSVIFLAKCQENAQTRIPASLMECYQVPELMQRDARLPMTMKMFIDLVKKVENDINGRNQDMRTLTKSFIHRFRLDGVVKASRITASNNVIPYSPKGFQFFKHRILLHQLVPGNAFQFPNSSLTSLEKCTLHHMMSSTVEEESRGDEGIVCGRLSQYRTQRLPRQIRTRPDVEVIDPEVVSKLNKRGNLKLATETPKPTDVNMDVPPGVYSSSGDVPLSLCPVEDGVVYTQAGAVALGPLLAGIAAGLEPQTVTLKDLSKAAGGDINSVVDDTITIDNRFAATLAGDLAEVTLRQGPVLNTMVMGASGGWNSTQAPRWYLLTQSSDYEMTDAEIRGGLDGLILAMKMSETLNRASGIKLSQLLDMYYSQRGLLSENLRACNRQALMSEVTKTEKLQTETLGFSLVLDKIMALQGTIRSEGFLEYSTKAVKSLYEYIPRSLNDLSCSASKTATVSTEVEPGTDIYIALDAMWTYPDISPSLAYLLDNLNIGLLGSNVTLLNAKDGKVIVNSTSSLSDFHQIYNASTHQTIPSGIDLPRMLMSIKQLQMDKVGNQSAAGWGGGRSTVVLVVASMSSINDADINYSIDQLRIFSEEIPDMQFFYLVSGSKDRFSQLVKDPVKDIFPLTVSSTDSTASQMNGVIKRIKDVPRRLVNHRCDANWVATSSGSSVVNEYITPQMINYYRLHPNYFFKSGSNSVVKIQGMGYGALTVCFSRSVELPKQSSSPSENNGVTCIPVNSNTLDIPLDGMCSDVSLIHKCSPLFISVEALPTTDNTQALRCSETSCPYPDSIKYTMTLQDLGCYSGASNILMSISLLIASIFISLKASF